MPKLNAIPTKRVAARYRKFFIGLFRFSGGDTPMTRASMSRQNRVEKPTIFLGAGEGNRTLVSSLEGYSFTIKLHPRAGIDCRVSGLLPNDFCVLSAED